jgi:hypothetical protein
MGRRGRLAYALLRVLGDRRAHGRGRRRRDAAEFLLGLRRSGLSIAAAAPELTFIKAGSLDDASWLEPAVEVWTSPAQPWSPHFEHAARMQRGPQ